LTDFVVTAAREAASRAIEEMEILSLSMEDQRTIAEALLNPPKAGPALRRRGTIALPSHAVKQHWIAISKHKPARTFAGASPVVSSRLRRLPARSPVLHNL